MFQLPRAAALTIAIAAFVFLAGVSEAQGQKTTPGKAVVVLNS